MTTILHTGMNPHVESIAGEVLQEEGELFRVVSLSERHGPLESEHHSAMIYRKDAPAGSFPINAAVELRRLNSSQGVARFPMRHDEADAFVLAYLEMLPEEEYRALLNRQERQPEPARVTISPAEG